jgi:hypothetical protein
MIPGRLSLFMPPYDDDDPDDAINPDSMLTTPVMV